jgi:glutamine synthetase
MIKAEYIWLDGTEPSAQIRSKTKIINNARHLPEWGFDGSSTNQAAGGASDCVLNPVFSCKDPVRGGDNILVLCEVLNVDGTAHKSNTRSTCKKTEDRFKSHQCWVGLEQEYTLMNSDGSPYGFVHARKEGGDILPQGPYYCSTGAGLAIGRDIVEDHLDACLHAGLKVSGVNAEVMPGQWEFQIGPAEALEGSDHLIVARWLLHRVAEEYGVVVSFDGKPSFGDWNGAGCHTNFSTERMRTSYDACIDACNALSENPEKHIQGYGSGIEDRLTGDHETCSHEDFKYGVSDRGASIRIPWQVERDRKGYIEDRRPNANCDPYVVTALLMNTICLGEVSVKRKYAPPY